MSDSIALHVPEAAAWEEELAPLLADLSEVQGDLLSLLATKQKLLTTGQVEQLAELEPREQELASRLNHCHERRLNLLAQAEQANVPAQNLQHLTQQLPAARRAQLRPMLDEAQGRARLLQHQSLANWVFVQRTILHLSQMLEIIATGGRRQPTYGKGDTSHTNGSLLDQAG